MSFKQLASKVLTYFSTFPMTYYVNMFLHMEGDGCVTPLYDCGSMCVSASRFHPITVCLCATMDCIDPPASFAVRQIRGAAACHLWLIKVNISISGHLVVTLESSCTTDIRSMKYPWWSIFKIDLKTEPISVPWEKKDVGALARVGLSLLSAKSWPPPTPSLCVPGYFPPSLSNSVGLTS